MNSSLNFFKGYGKVEGNHIEDQQPSHPNPTTKRPLITIVAISAILLLTVILAATFASLVLESNTESAEEEFSSLPPAESIKAVCSVTQYPDSCFTSISSINTSPKPDPELIFKLSLQASVTQLSDLSSFLKTLSSNSIPNGPPPDSAVSDCRSLFDDALSRLNDSVSTMEVGKGKKVLTKGKIDDIKTWVSGAMTDQETCLDGLEEMGSTALVEVKGKVQRSREYLSNSLAIVDKMYALLDKFDLTLH
ncbi:hypothetical protein L1049_028023 [Liquidambar formosana]|uniref:pectinesterase n=1 Tax=Liquidambar formosana TaxID=63359 RepID=A0AAP0RJR5_LIQFO